MVVQEALDRIMVNTTTVVVAHRLSTVRSADMIAVVHQGRIVEKGSHLELLHDAEGAYSQLVKLQAMNRGEEEKSGCTDESSRHPSQRTSQVLHSLSRGSSGQGSSRNSVPGTAFGEEKTGFEPTEKPPKVSVRRLAYLNKPEFPVLAAGTLASIISGVILPVFGLLMSKVVTIFFEPHSKLKKDSVFWACMCVALGGAGFVTCPARDYLFSLGGCKLIKRIRSMCFEKVINMEASWFDEPTNSSGAIGARLSLDATIQVFASAFAGLVIAFTASWQMAFIVLALVPLLGLNGVVQAKFLKGFSADAKMMYEEASQVATDVVGTIRTIASFYAEEQMMELYKNKCEGPMKSGMREGLINGIGFGVSFLLLYCVYATSFYAGAHLVAD